MYDVFDEVIKRIKTAQNSQCKDQRTWRLLNLSNRNYSNGKQNEKKNILKKKKRIKERKSEWNYSLLLQIFSQKKQKDFTASKDYSIRTFKGKFPDQKNYEA